MPEASSFACGTSALPVSLKPYQSLAEGIYWLEGSHHCLVRHSEKVDPSLCRISEPVWSNALESQLTLALSGLKGDKKDLL